VRAHARTAIVLPLSDISSTDIRARAAVGLPIADLVPPQVASYIDRHALYRAATGS
jgi:nicotinate-nucleotide adenylyltransferase